MQEFITSQYDTSISLALASYLGLPSYTIFYHNVTVSCICVSCASFNTTNAFTALLTVTLPLGSADAILLALTQLGDGTSAAAANFTSLLQTAGMVRVQGIRLPDGAALVRTQGPPPRPPWPPRPPRPPPAAPGTIDRNKSGSFSSTNPFTKKVIIDAGTDAGIAIAGVAALWFIVHSVAHALIAAHQRRTCVTVAVVLQCTTAAQLHADAKHDDEVHGVHVSSADAGSLAMVGKRFKAPLAASLLATFLAQEASSANALDMLPPPRRVALRPLQRTPLVRAAASKKEHTAGTLALRKKPLGLLWRLKRFVGTELRWQAREFRTLGRYMRRCCGGSRDAVGKVFRLVPCAGAAVQESAVDSVDPAHALARQLAQGDGGAPTAVLFEASFHFGVAGRDAAAVWRQRLRSETQLLDLEAALAVALRTGELLTSSKEGPPSTSSAGAAAEPTELKCVGAAAIALLDDEPHANLDKKRVTTSKIASAAGASPEEHAHDAAARSFGLAPAVASRLAAVLLLSLHDDTTVAGAAPGGATAHTAEVEEGAQAV